MAEFVPNNPAIEQELNGIHGAVYRAARRFADAVVADVKEHGPLGFDQGGHRAVGLLRDDMRVRDEEFGSLGIKIVVGTDPANPNDGYHYARVIHEGRPGFESKSGPMIFQTRDGAWHERDEVGPAEAQPFLYEAVERVNAADPEVKLILVKTP